MRIESKCTCACQTVHEGPTGLLGQPPALTAPLLQHSITIWVATLTFSRHAKDPLTGPPTSFPPPPFAPRMRRCLTSLAIANRVNRAVTAGLLFPTPPAWGYWDILLTEPSDSNCRGTLSLSITFRLRRTTWDANARARCLLLSDHDSASTIFCVVFVADFPKSIYRTTRLTSSIFRRSKTFTIFEDQAQC